MDFSKEHIIEPNKKGAVKLCSILIPLMVALGALFLFVFKGELFEFFHVITMRAETVGISMISLSIIPVLILLYTFNMKNRIRVNSEGIHLSEKVFIRWGEIDYCQLQQIIGPPVMIQIYLNDGKQYIIGWQMVDFGISKLFDEMNKHLDTIQD